jgi:hypothetical protein
MLPCIAVVQAACEIDAAAFDNQMHSAAACKVHRTVPYDLWEWVVSLFDACNAWMRAALVLLRKDVGRFKTHCGF